MGCWNHTCAVTNLPIFAGDEVEVMLLRRPEFKEKSLCYPTNTWMPLPLTFNGKYDDYGSVEDCQGVALPLLLSAIQDNLAEMEIGENQYHDIAVKKEAFDIKLLFQADHEDRLGIYNDIYCTFKDIDVRPILRVKHTVIKKSVYEHIVSNFPLSAWNEEDKLLGQLNVQEFIDLMKPARDILSGRLAGVIPPKCDHPISRLLLGENSVRSRWERFPLDLGELVSTEMDLDDPAAVEIVTNALKVQVFNRFMDSSRRSYCLPSGAGSQDESTVAQRLCAELTMKEAEIIDHRWDDE